MFNRVAGGPMGWTKESDIEFMTFDWLGIVWMIFWFADRLG
jgi:hypothetical protein